MGQDGSKQESSVTGVDGVHVGFPPGSSSYASSRRASRTGTYDGESSLLQTFAGSNGAHEIETLREFHKQVDRELRENGNKRSSIDFSTWVFQQVDFTRVPAEEWAEYNFKGASFWGCTLPQHASKDALEEQGANVMVQPEGLPFLAIRAHMYRQEELQDMDAAAYQWFLDNRGIRSLIAQSIHDFFIQDALMDYLEGKTVVVVMGGHGLKRNSEDYKQVARLGFALANAGYVVATGGGPGAMEATNLGAYMVSRGGEAELEAALNLLIESANPGIDPEYKDVGAAAAVLERYGWPTWEPSLGVPTYVYGHEPSNVFCTWQAKMFSNAIREDGLIQIANGGIIYTPGSAGTRQEVFQAACKNHYAASGAEVPMVFWGSKFWSDSGIYDALERNSRDRPMHKWLSLTDSVSEVVEGLVKYRTLSRLPPVRLSALETQHRRYYAPDAAGPCEETAELRAGRRTRRNVVQEQLQAYHARRALDLPLANAKLPTSLVTEQELVAG
eukprot:TRINITY_DN6079_c0_g1_i1.p1 TRINITY_DN6079_c0_g1~~TRINITY_DN6079_c0_g1_i1.p1  ORF type:complete len:537 (-),score=134.76 TRINITY_DN6079_c0_g1_i1:253-1755(-)